MRLPTFAFLICYSFACVVHGEEARLARFVDTSIIFRDDMSHAQAYPHTLQVFLKIRNRRDGELSWIPAGISAELFDSTGKPVPMPPSAASIRSSDSHLTIPYGSSLDLLISNGGISMMGDAGNSYALIVGCRGWYIPRDSVSSYSLRIRLYGYLGYDKLPNDPPDPTLLIDMPLTKIQLTK